MNRSGTDAALVTAAASHDKLASGRPLTALATLTLHTLHDLPDDVDQLYAHAQARDPQLSAAWLRNLADTVFDQPPGAVSLHVLRRNGRAVAALPLVVRAQRGGASAQSLSNYYSSLFAPALADDLQLPELVHLLKHLRDAHRPLARLQLAPMDGNAPAFALLRQALAQAGLVPFDYFCFGNWYHPVNSGAEAYLAGRPGEVRNTLRRMGKKFAAAGGTLDIWTQPEQAPLAAAEFTRIYQLSWKQPEPYDRFIPGLVDLCARAGWLRMGLAFVGGQAVAAQLWIVASGKASIYKLAYDPAYKHLSPGSLLTAHLMQHSIDVDGVREIDYLTGDDAYKNQWMSHRRERRGLLAFNPRTAGGLAGLLREKAAHAAKPWRDRLRKARQPAAAVMAPADTSPERPVVDTTSTSTAATAGTVGRR